MQQPAKPFRGISISVSYTHLHIPIILLTAKASEEHQLEGLNVGADDYIPKPFNMEVLKLRINKIIEMQDVYKRQ